MILAILIWAKGALTWKPVKVVIDLLQSAMTNAYISTCT
jgi:hypothetical protein